MHGKAVENCGYYMDDTIFALLKKIKGNTFFCNVEEVISLLNNFRNAR